MKHKYDKLFYIQFNHCFDCQLKYEEPATDTSSPEDPALSDADQEYLNTLEDLKNKAKEMGDEKLENQIDNTITYFTRQHIVKEGDTDNDRAEDDKRLGTKGEKIFTEQE